MSSKERMKKWREATEVHRSLQVYNGVEGIDFVTCQICGKRGLYVDARHLKTRHSLAIEEYISKFPQCKITSDKKAEAQRRFGNKSNLGRKFSYEHRAKIAFAKLGDKNPSWFGGVSLNKYCALWRDKEFKRYIVERDSCKCFLCSSLDDIVVHHINYDKRDCRPNNLITLCKPCNSKVNFNRDYWQIFFNK
jgi:hypothetical protein